MWCIEIEQLLFKKIKYSKATAVSLNMKQKITQTIILTTEKNPKEL